MQYTTTYHSPLGSLVLAEKNGALTGLWMEGQKYFLGSVKEEMEEKNDSAIFDQAKEWLDRYFRGEKPSAAELALAPHGSEFRKEVWKILCEIPYGDVTTYGEISKKIAARRGLERMSAQAVGGAVSHNPISIIIPCHRVVGSDGSLTGYAGGLAKKIQLLTIEGVDMKKLFVPAKGTAL
ncbi:methylated-DNA--[protein]-cysteine S-methyltransferase [Clostridium sp. MCC353]|uniref:methylated-DNA--[protein]-cysteine S-methyltransferase n=1 Tax=Clostridium sp. MCC353 TaxID=2592646 RepID=UPI001C02A37E|nr:methylated-DNA--[protein]-cysteine S-methyltransferase [Clostridium sp. MCC353]MBT9775311.1 methylated-DNA--[protein]-cysteine S-methyltransferase [Clostridium sp. MCC353]